jgi:molybdopterin-guanine dinucleotide biosynthesis protein A
LTTNHGIPRAINKEGESLNLFNTAIIIAGGKSRRMGFDKALMKMGNTTCIELIIQKLKKHFDEIIIAAGNTNKYGFLGEKTVIDEIKNAGPIGGLHAGLKSSNSIYNYLIACDMPVICDDLISDLRRMVAMKPDIIACKNNDFIEPFHGVYSKSLITRIEQQVNNDGYSIFNLMKHSNTEIIHEAKITKLCKGLPIFTNLNTRQNLEQFRSYLVGIN